MLVERYSYHAFTPQKQFYHLKHHVYPHLYEWGKLKKTLPKHLQECMQLKHKELLKLYKDNFNDFTEGVWVFPYGCKDNKSLNHVKHRLPAWVAELPEDIVVYDVNWEYQTTLSDPICEIFGCYVPKRSLENIRNIQRKNKYERRVG